MARSAHAALAALLALALGSCATNRIRLDRATTMVAAGRTASDATTALMERTRAANRETLIEMVSIDSNCTLPQPVRASVGASSAVRFCPPGDRIGPRDRPMRRIVPADFEPTLAVLRALSGYLDEVDAVVTREPLDIGADLAAAQSDLRILLGAAQAVAGSDAALPTLAKDQQAAIDGALKLLSTVLDEQGRVDDLRAIETLENRALFNQTVGKLADANQTWMSSFSGQLLNRKTLLEDRLESLHGAPPDKRRPIAQSLMETIEDRENVPRLRAALTEVLVRLQTAHAAYLDLLDNRNAKLTAKEKRRVAQLNHDRVLGALQSLTALIRAF